jgi:hypothetical protein
MFLSSSPATLPCLIVFRHQLHFPVHLHYVPNCTSLYSGNSYPAATPYLAAEPLHFDTYGSIQLQFGPTLQIGPTLQTRPTLPDTDQ